MYGVNSNQNNQNEAIHQNFNQMLDKFNRFRVSNTSLNIDNNQFQNSFNVKQFNNSTCQKSNETLDYCTKIATHTLTVNQDSRLGEINKSVYSASRHDVNSEFASIITAAANVASKYYSTNQIFINSPTTPPPSPQIQLSSQNHNNHYNYHQFHPLNNNMYESSNIVHYVPPTSLLQQHLQPKYINLNSTKVNYYRLSTLPKPYKIGLFHISGEDVPLPIVRRGRPRNIPPDESEINNKKIKSSQ